MTLWIKILIMLLIIDTKELLGLTEWWYTMYVKMRIDLIYKFLFFAVCGSGQDSLSDLGDVQ